MERPKEIRDANPKLKKYVEYLEEKLSKFDAETTIAKLYVSIKNQVDNTSKLLNEIKITKDDLKDKDEKFFDRYLSYLVKADKIAGNLLSIEKMIDPAKIEKAQKDHDDTADRHIFSKDQTEEKV